MPPVYSRWKGCYGSRDPNVQEWTTRNHVHIIEDVIIFPYLRINYSGTVRTGKTRTSCSYSAYDKENGIGLWIENVFGPSGLYNLRKSLADPFIRFCVKFETLKDHQKQTIQGKLKFDSFLRYTIKFQIGRERSAVPCLSQDGRSVERVVLLMAEIWLISWAWELVFSHSLHGFSTHPSWLFGISDPSCSRENVIFFPYNPILGMGFFFPILYRLVLTYPSWIPVGSQLDPSCWGAYIYPWIVHPLKVWFRLEKDFLGRWRSWILEGPNKNGDKL